MMGGQRIVAETIATKAIQPKVPLEFSLIADRQHGSEIQSIAAPLVLGAALMSTVGGNHVVRCQFMV